MTAVEGYVVMSIHKRRTGAIPPSLQERACPSTQNPPAATTGGLDECYLLLGLSQAAIIRCHISAGSQPLSPIWAIMFCII